jgi:hypothetical protein
MFIPNSDDVFCFDGFFDTADIPTQRYGQQQN